MASYTESGASAKAVRFTMERGGDRHFTADGSDPKPPCPAEAKNVNCGLECSFPCVSTLLGESMLSAPWGDAREPNSPGWYFAGRKEPHPTSAGKG